MLVTAYGAVKAGAFSSSPHDSPLLKLLIALGVICGFAGYPSFPHPKHSHSYFRFVSQIKYFLIVYFRPSVKVSE